MEAIVLAGGLGTRLRNAVPDLPKPMAPIRGRPFLEFVLDDLIEAGFERAILAVGYRHEIIRRHFGTCYGNLELRYSIEEKPLGTGGAIRLALGQTDLPNVFVLNGDTYLELDYTRMRNAHAELGAGLTVAVHPVDDASRYGALDIEGGRIRGFHEKGRSGPGTINGGVYVLSRSLPARYRLPEVHSFENDFLVPNAESIRPLAFAAHGRFIDIGVPEDYERAQCLLGDPGSGAH